jgi:peptide-methionine (S)-S-oxide reductase
MISCQLQIALLAVSRRGGCFGIKGGYGAPTLMKLRSVLLLLFPALLMSATAQANTASNHEFITLGGGCFWCMEAVYQRVPGIVKSVSGYAGGHTQNPTYDDICGHGTGHAEVVQLEFDPAVIGLDRIFEIFFEAHDPTTLNRQGADEGDQYRSVIYYANEAQHQAALAAKAKAQPNWADPIVTEIAALPKFWRAEDYHQDYFNQHPGQGYCVFVIKPKVKKLQDHGVISPDAK